MGVVGCDEIQGGNLAQRGLDIALKRAHSLTDILEDMYDAQDNPQGFISLGISENRLMHDEMIAFAKSSFAPTGRQLSYGDGFFGSKRLRSALAAFLTKHFCPQTPILPAHVVITSGVTCANEACTWTLADENDGILLGRPFYRSFPNDIHTRPKTQIIKVSFGDVDPFSPSVASIYEQALVDSHKNGVRVRALMLCSPHNPLGHCYSVDALKAIMRMCERHRIHLISDEVYALSTWTNPEAPCSEPFTSVLAIDTTDVIDPSRVHVLWGMSKDFCANGIRLGCIVSQHNDEFINSLHPFSLKTAPSSLADHLAYSVLSNPSFTDSFIATNRQRLAQGYALATRFLRDHRIPYYPGASAAFFLWVDLAVLHHGEGVERSLEMERAITAKLMANKIFLGSGETFGAEEHGWFRIVFSHPEAYLMRGLERIVEVLGK